VPLTIEHSEGLIHIKKTENGKHRVSVNLFNKKGFISRNVWETSYPLDLIRKILEVKGPMWLCDEIARDEDESYVQKYLEYTTLSYVEQSDISAKRILDFGCGCGSSTMVLARLFENSEIVGLELEQKFRRVAQLRAKHYGFEDVNFITSPGPTDFPSKLGEFDYIFLNAVYEHLLPNERKILLPKIWFHLKAKGILFINETPHRFFPIEVHTTGMPLINYLPDKMALYLAQRFSKRVQQNETWETLLRKGIRGGTQKEILKILNINQQKPTLLRPIRPGIKDQSDIWFKISTMRSLSFSKKFVICLIKFLKKFPFLPMTPYISLAIQKSTP